MATLLRIFKLVVVASFFWRKNSNIVFLPSFYTFRSKPLSSLFGRRKYPNLAELRMEMFVELLVSACKRNMGLEKLWKPRGAGFWLPEGLVLCTCPDGKFSPLALVYSLRIHNMFLSLRPWPSPFHKAFHKSRQATVTCPCLHNS